MIDRRSGREERSTYGRRAGSRCRPEAEHELGGSLTCLRAERAPRNIAQSASRRD